jgi:EAL domain-containing protein (putative c-di-GMP-specific phosphodiesterase class I)
VRGFSRIRKDKLFLLANGCDVGQGYLVSRPAPFDDIIHFAAESWSAASLLTAIG